MTQIPSNYSSENSTNGYTPNSGGLLTESQTPQPNEPLTLPPLLPYPNSTSQQDGATGLLQLIGKKDSAKKSTPLRRQLLLRILPAVLLPLAIASAVGYTVIQRRAGNELVAELEKQSRLASEAASQFVEDAVKTPLSVASNPLVIDAVRASSQNAEAEGLVELPIDELERRFEDTRLLKLNQVLNNYMVTTANNAGLAKLHITERNGFVIAYSSETNDFVQADEQWWQDAKTNTLWIQDPEVDVSTNTFAVDMSHAILEPNSGKFLGVVQAIVPSSAFARLETLLQQANLSGSQQVQLLDASSSTVINTLREGGSSDTREIVGGEAIAQISKDLVKVVQDKTLNLEDVLSESQNKYAFQNLKFIPLAEATERSRFSVSFNYQGKQYVLTTLPRVDYVAVASMDIAQIQGASQDLLGVFALTALVLGVVATVITVQLAGQLSAPLNELSSKAQQMSAGNLDVTVEPRGSTEAQTLAQTFNNLVASVKGFLHEQAQAAEQSRELEVTEKLAQEQRQLKEALQKRALELLMEVDPISKGDLTIRAKVTEDEIGTIADSYNATIANLRKIVLQVQAAASQVAETTSINEVSVQALSAEALRQAEEIGSALERVHDMAQAVRIVAANAEQAEVAVQQATQTVEEGDAAMNRTVEGILKIRETVAETAKKVKRLGESSQKISTVVNLISTFAAQTNLLALNASIEAARAGEEGRGFAVVADEVRALARQSGEATAEIEKLVASIQTETNEVVTAMEAGTEQVVMGTKLVDETRQSLNKITAASVEINQLVEAISQATLVQAQAAENVTQTMTNVAAIANKTSTEVYQVSLSFGQLRTVAQALQEEVGQFKVS